MARFTYKFPDSTDFLYTLRLYLHAISQSDIAVLLHNSSCNFFSHNSFSEKRENAYNAGVRFFVPVVRIQEFTEVEKHILLNAVKQVFPKEAGYEIVEVKILFIIDNLPNNEPIVLNSASLVSTGSLEYDQLRFRSQSEIAVYKVLKKRNVLFFANATAVLGSKNVKKEPDFLICKNGKWGILEVMGDRYHPPTTAMQDHDRARLFKDYGVSCIEFYDAPKCYNTPEEVVDDFLDRLSKL
ncbi:hypothetical protein QUA27_25425 [Microcoleus sp. Pol14C6]|uniref:hypothetical protein n=1 Tax=unclassified Microcoleus TaxID=2642155 RepID=UPI002FD71F56